MCGNQSETESRSLDAGPPLMGGAASESLEQQLSILRTDAGAPVLDRNDDAPGGLR